MAHGKIDKEYADDFISSKFIQPCFLVLGLFLEIPYGHIPLCVLDSILHVCQHHFQ